MYMYFKMFFALCIAIFIQSNYYILLASDIYKPVSFLHFKVYTKVLVQYWSWLLYGFFYLYKYLQFVLYSHIFTMCNQIYKHICPICPWPVIFIKLGYLNVICMFILLSNLVPSFCDGFHSAHFFLFYKLSLFIHIFFYYLYTFNCKYWQFLCKRKNIKNITFTYMCIYQCCKKQIFTIKYCAIHRNFRSERVFTILVVLVYCFYQ